MTDEITERQRQILGVIEQHQRERGFPPSVREIGQAARKQLEVFLNRKVYLGLEVIVIPGWREDEEALRELGYE